MGFYFCGLTNVLICNTEKGKLGKIVFNSLCFCCVQFVCIATFCCPVAFDGRSTFIDLIQFWVDGKLLSRFESSDFKLIRRSAASWGIVRASYAFEPRYFNDKMTGSLYWKRYSPKFVWFSGCHWVTRRCHCRIRRKCRIW